MTQLDRILCRLALLLCVSLGAHQAGAVPAHCIAPDGSDLNAITGVSEQILMQFCPVADAHQPWRTLARWDTAYTYDPAQIPPGFDPGGLTPPEQFVAALANVYVLLDAGEPGARDLLFNTGEFFVSRVDDLDFVTLRVVTPSIDALGVGSHHIQLSLIFSEDHWDGLGTIPDENLLPAGEIPYTDFIVQAVPAPASFYLLVLGLAGLARHVRNGRRATAPA